MNRIAKNFEKELKELGIYEEFSSLNSYVGDIHNHCGISYGYGKLENAIAFAKTQLDFFSVTGHFAWPDMENDSKMMIPPDVVKYHKEGFAKLRRNWPEYKRLMKECESDGFIPFFSYEYHSFKYGDYTILCKNTDEDLPNPVEEGEEDNRLTNLLNGDEKQTDRFLSTPHHIGYKEGYRGISWKYFNEKVSPVVEIVSMHGCAESYEAHPLYLHTMGPRSSKNTYQGGLSLKHHFGVVGSTDHHNAAPGSYGSGRTVLFLPNIDRESIWNALKSRHTSAASGDPIETLLIVNNAIAGDIAPKHNGFINIEGFVAGFDKLDKVEIIQDGNVIAGEYSFNGDDSYEGFISFKFGWGKKHKAAIWDIELEAENGEIKDYIGRLRGIDMVDPLDVPKDSGSTLPRLSFDGKKVVLHVVTDGNPTAQTDSTAGLALEVEGNKNTKIICSVKVLWNNEIINKCYEFKLSELKETQQTQYINGFVSPAIEVGLLRTNRECCCHIKKTIKTESQGAVYLRAYEKNGDCVFTSPISFR